MTDAIELVAFRRNDDEHAAELRTEIPRLLGRLAAEVPGSVFELLTRTDPEGIVGAEFSVTSDELPAELLSEAAAVLEPVAELRHVDDRVEPAPTSVWPFVASARTVLGFGRDDEAPAPSVVWSSAAMPGVPELVELVNPYAGVGVRVRLRAADDAGGTRQRWEVDMAVITADKPTLRLRAAVRTLYPGLEVAAEPGGAPAVLQVLSGELPAAFAVPVAGEQPIPGTYVGTAIALPIHPTRSAIASPQDVRVGAAVTVSGKRLDVKLSRDERLRHVHVLGRTGTGKSSFLAGFVHEVANTGDGALVLDPHGALVDRILAELPAEAAARTWVIRCGDVDNAVPLNPMSVDDVVRREIAIDDICATFQYIFDKKHTGVVGPRFRERVAMGLRALAAQHGRRASLLDVPAALGNTSFMIEAAALSDDDRLRAWIANDQRGSGSSDHSEVVAWVNSKFEAFSSTTAMRAILGSGEDALDVAQAMDSGRIILVDLSKGDLGESSTRLLGYMYLNEAWIGALQRTDRNRPFTIVVDEAQSMISGTLSAMLSEGRKFGLSVVLAHQYLGQLDEDLQPAIDGNVATTVAFRGSGADAPALRQRFGGAVETATLMTLPDLSAITLRTAAHVTGEPYTLIVDHNNRVPGRRGAELDEFRAGIMDRTIRELVADYRDRTAAAAAGKSNVAAYPAPRSSATGAKVRQRPKPPTPGAADPPPKQNSSFLDEWLAKRHALGAPEEEDPDAPEEK